MAKRKRNYAAEYKRRIARAEAQGKTRQAGRGHKAAEHVERARRTRAKFGVSPGTLTRLRRLAREKVRGILDAIRKHRFDEAYFERGFRLIHAEDLRTIIDADAMEIVNYVKLGAGGPPGLAAIDLAQMAEFTPYSMEDIEDADRNPFWYH